MLEEFEVTNRDTGVFYGPNQTIYQFVEPNLRSDGIYKLFVDIDEGRKNISTETRLVQLEEMFRGTTFGALKITGMNFAKRNELSDGHDIFIRVPVNSKRVQLKMYFNYADVIAVNGDTTQIDQVVEFGFFNTRYLFLHPEA